MAVETDWQTTIPTVRERTKFMFNNEHLSDVKFVVQGGDGERENKRSVVAHKFVLSIGSPVFEAMFYSELAETKNAIELPDCDYESLLELLRYLYSDEVKLSGSNVMGVLYLANKYMVPSLADKCTEYLQGRLDPSNVFLVLPAAQKYELKNLVNRCWKVIEKEAEAALKSDGFKLIEKSLLGEVISREALAIREVEVFKACDQWATEQCKKQGLATDGERKRRILGEQVIKAIRFPVMTQDEFADVVLDAKILTPDEIIMFFKVFSSKLTSPTGFLHTPRYGVIHRLNRFPSIKRSSWQYNGSSFKDSVKFVVDKDIILHGLCLFGTGENDSYEIILLELKDANKSTLAVSKPGTYSSKPLTCENYDYRGFEVLFTSRAYLRKNTLYQVEALISGPPSAKGCNGFKSVSMSGVTFTFKSDLLVLATNSNSLQGQFPEFLFEVSL